MSTEHIVSLLVAERTRLDAAIAALQGSPEQVPAADVYDDPTMPEWVKPASKKVPTSAPAPQKRKLSAAGRKAIIAATKKRWAAIRAAKAEEAAPKKKTKAAIIAEAIAPPEDAEFKKKMSEAMKASWAKRKKVAKRKKA
jgi:hypothetical protein